MMNRENHLMLIRSIMTWRPGRKYRRMTQENTLAAYAGMPYRREKPGIQPFSG
jgi:hypothetical protein